MICDNHASVDTEFLYKKLSRYVAKNKLKSTRQREMIVDVFFSMTGRHIKIEELLETVRKKYSKIGYATVYRTLLLLVDAGVANQRHFQDGHSRFEINFATHHDHLICQACDQIIEFKDPTIEKIQRKIAKKHGFELKGHKMELYGLCQKCSDQTQSSQASNL